VASTVSTVMIIGGLVAAFYLAPGGVIVRHDFFNPHYVWESLVGNHSKALSSVGLGLLINIRVFMIAEVFILTFGLTLAWTRMTKSPVLMPFRILAVIYSDIFRGSPSSWSSSSLGTGCRACNSASSPISPPVGLWRRGAHPHLQRLRRRGLSSGHLLGAARTDPGRAFRSALTNATTMRAGDSSPGRAHGHPPSFERLHFVAKDTPYSRFLGVMKRPGGHHLSRVTI